MSEMRGRIIDYLRRNRVSTTEAADALGKRGVLPESHALNPGLYCVGEIHPIFVSNGSNYGVHNQLRAVTPHQIPVIFTHNCDGKAVLGELVAKFALLYRRAEALVVDGSVRDGAGLRREGYAIWSTGVTPLGCVNSNEGPFPLEQERELSLRYAGGIAICDDGGVVLLEASDITDETLARLEFIELQEDIWAFCLNTLKWDTYQIVVEKKYLKYPELLPEAYSSALGRYIK